MEKESIISREKIRRQWEEYEYEGKATIVEELTEKEEDFYKDPNPPPTPSKHSKARRERFLAKQRKKKRKK